ncbi:putative multiple sugar transport system permease protein [Ruminococcaceae bacterium YAD3003]|nr:putative multiple sugar transport system permease protein [Ruminococcaceae bacterium YAD3003]
MNTFSIKNVLKKNVMAIALLVIFVFFTIMTKGLMFSSSNVASLIDQKAYVYILGAGMLMCMLTGGNIDLSVGSFLCFAGAVAGVFSVIWYINTPLSLLLVLGVGLVYGAILGFLIAYVRIPPWIATLAGYLAFRGLATQILVKVSDTSAISNFSPEFLHLFSGNIFTSPVFQVKLQKLGLWLNIPCLVLGVLATAAIVVINFMTRAKKAKKGYEAEPVWFVAVKSVIEGAIILILSFKFSSNGDIVFEDLADGSRLEVYKGGIPVVVLWLIGVLLFYGIITEKTTIGRHFMTVGGNAETAKLSGINNKLVMFVAYLNMSVLTVLAALIVTARFSSANAFAGQNFEMDAIAACIVGGVSAYGGSGSIIGMVIGATLIGVIDQGMSLMQIDQDWIKIVKGLVLLAAVVFEIVSKQGKLKIKKKTSKKEKVQKA